MSAEDVFNAYLQKNAINHGRQEKDYSRASKNEDDNKSIQL